MIWIYTLAKLGGYYCKHVRTLQRIITHPLTPQHSNQFLVKTKTYFVNNSKKKTQQRKFTLLHTNCIVRITNIFYHQYKCIKKTLLLPPTHPTKPFQKKTCSNNIRPQLRRCPPVLNPASTAPQLSLFPGFRITTNSPLWYVRDKKVVLFSQVYKSKSTSIAFSTSQKRIVGNKKVVLVSHIDKIQIRNILDPPLWYVVHTRPPPSGM